MSELKNKLDNLVREYSMDEVMSEIGFGEIVAYVKSHSSLIDRQFLIRNNDDAVKTLKGVARYVNPRGMLTKEDVKREINDFIDTWYV